MPELTEELWNKLWKAQQEREAQQREQIRLAVASSDVPLPEHLVQAVMRLSASHAEEILREHRGYRLAARRDSYLTSLAIMEDCFRDLLASIESFEREALAEDSQLFSQRREPELREIERRIQKELFATANAAASLVDHSRRVHKLEPFSDYDAQRVACFGTDGLHEFVIGLRVILHHLHEVEAEWNVQRQFVGETNIATFTINKTKVQRVLRDSLDSFPKRSIEAAQAYVEAAPENMDLRTIFIEYSGRVMKFHEWMKTALNSDSLAALRDYDCIIQEKANLDARRFWKALMANWLNWQTPPDPHAHLSRFLTPVQLEEVYKLPRNSKEQVDLVISCMDRHNAIDDELRQQAYKLFELSPTHNG